MKWTAKSSPFFYPQQSLVKSVFPAIFATQILKYEEKYSADLCWIYDLPIRFFPEQQPYKN